DIDLLVASSGKVSLWRNMRDGTFRDVATEVGLTDLKGATSVAAGDVNKDGFTDFYFGSPNDGYFALSNGKERFQVTKAEVGGVASQCLDYDNDGLLDLVSVVQGQLRIQRNTGNAWTDVTAKATKSITVGIQSMLAAGDIDGRGENAILFGTA